MQYGSIGWSLGAAAGAYFANTNKRIFLFIGDGAFQMTVQAISTMVRYNMKGLIFLVNTWLCD